MNYYIYLIIVFVFLYTISCFLFSDEIESEHMDGALIQLMAKGSQDVYLTTDTEKYISPYYVYGNYAYNNVNPWYGETPFAWGNGTKINKWGRLPYYERVHNWYYDTFLNGYY